VDSEINVTIDFHIICDSSSSTSSMTVREGEYENRSTEIMLEKFADGFGFVVLTKRLDRNGQILIKYH